MMQGTPEWIERRRGKVTASRVKDILATTKSGPSASRKNYLAQLVAERLSGNVEAGFTSAAMQWGTDNEPLARAAYEIATGNDVDQIDFIDHQKIEMSGASPDGMAGADGLVEIKCPNTATHIEYLLSKDVPKDYIPQMTWQIACSGRKWCDFVSYDPRMPDDLRLFVVRFTPTKEEIADIESKVSAFLAEVQETINKLTKRTT